MRLRWKLVAGTALALAVGLGAWVLWGGRPADLAGLGPAPVQVSGLMPEFDLEALITGDNLPVVGMVDQVLGCARGQGPGRMGWIHTNVALKVERYPGQRRPHERVYLRILGGRVGDEGLSVEGAPELVPGRRVLLFLYRPEGDMLPVPSGCDPDAYYLVVAHGVFDIQDGTAVCRSTGKRYDLERLLADIAQARRDGGG